MKNKHKYSYLEVTRLVYIWGRYEGLRDATKEGKHYDAYDIKELVRRLNKFAEYPTSFNEGFEKEEVPTTQEDSTKEQIKQEIDNDYDN